jgi:sugar phosphate isomerase/epimerase
MIYVSTGGVPNRTAYETACEFFDSNIFNCELSGGLFQENIKESLINLKSKGNIQLHNYFPPPKIPLVMNLASKDSNVVQATINHIENAIKLSHEIGNNIYSFHAGYLVDPKVDELGRRVQKQLLSNRKEALHNFIDNVNNLALYAKKLNITLLIENNVLSHNNYKCFGKNPFLMVDQKECEYVMRNTMDNVFLLIDVAHLKVSANSLNFDKLEFLKKVSPWVRAYHLSENNGLADTNESVRETSWFWPYISKNLDYYSLEIYGKNSEQLADQVKLTKYMLSIDL